MSVNYKEKYLKYKIKYLNLQKQIGGNGCDSNPNICLSNCNGHELLYNNKAGTYTYDNKKYTIKHKNGEIYLYNNMNNRPSYSKDKDHIGFDDSCKKHIKISFESEEAELPINNTILKNDTDLTEVYRFLIDNYDKTRPSLFGKYSMD